MRSTNGAVAIAVLVALVAGLGMAVAEHAKKDIPQVSGDAVQVRKAPPMEPEGTNRIVNGEPAPREWLFVASVGRMVGNTYRHYCGGSLISDNWVLTAAHCPVKTTDLVVIGRYDLREPGGDVFRIERHVRHPSYDAATTDNDVALIKLEAPATTLKKVGIGMATPPVGSAVTATGWGYVKENGPLSPTLLRVSVPVVSQTECRQDYQGDRVAITDNMFCAGEADKDSCQGDSGGPLLVGIGDSLKQVGIVSFGIGCGRKGYPGVYTRLENYRNWVRQTTGEALP